MLIPPLPDHALQTLAVAIISLSTNHTLLPPLMTPFNKVDPVCGTCVLDNIVHVPVCILPCPSVFRSMPTPLDQLCEDHHMLEICEAHGFVRRSGECL